MASISFEGLLDLERDPTREELRSVLNMLHVAEDLIAHLPPTVVSRYCQLKETAARKSLQNSFNQSHYPFGGESSNRAAGIATGTRDDEETTEFLDVLQSVREEMDSLLLQFATDFPHLCIETRQPPESETVR